MKSGTIEQVVKDMKSGTYNFTKDGKCSNCGACCSDFLPMTDKELAKIKQYVKTHHIKDQELKVVASGTMNLVCPFRDEGSKKCVIYEIRPMICREFRCDKPSSGRPVSEGMMKYYKENDVQVVMVREEVFGIKR